MNKTILFISLLAIASCSKSDSAKPSNTVSVSASVEKEYIGAPGNYYWKARSTLSSTVNDSSFIVVKWDVHQATGSFVATLKDTVKLSSTQVTYTKLTNTIAGTNVAQNVKITSAWSKSGQYTYQY